MTINLRYEFRGLCREAMDFYRKALGFELESVATYGERGDLGVEVDCARGALIEKAVLAHPDGCRLYMCDSFSLLFAPDPIAEINKGHLSEKGCICGAPFEIFSEHEDEIERLYDLLTENGAIVHVPLGPSNGLKLYASVMDRFNLNWNLHCL